jgi:hypothetical protein
MMLLIHVSLQALASDGDMMPGTAVHGQQRSGFATVDGQLLIRLLTMLV